MKLVFFLLFVFNAAFSQNYAGFVKNSTDKKPIEFVSIGIEGKDIGTVSDANGHFKLEFDNKYNSDSIRFSMIGFEPVSLKVSDFKQMTDKTIYLHEKIYALQEIFVTHKTFKQKTLGCTADSKSIRGGFKENNLGYEMGVYLKIKKSAIIKKINLNIAECSYDTIHYRLNIYKAVGKNDFQNIMTKPVYFKLSKDKVNNQISIDLTKENIHVKGDCLVTIEHIKNLGNGALFFSASFFGKTYYRKTSQGIWDTKPIGIGISIDADIEK